MAEGFYSLHSDEPAVIMNYSNNNNCHHTQQFPQGYYHSFNQQCEGQSAGDMDFLPDSSSSYFINNSIAVNNDYDNNEFSGGGGCGGAGGGGGVISKVTGFDGVHGMSAFFDNENYNQMQIMSNNFTNRHPVLTAGHHDMSYIQSDGNCRAGNTSFPSSMIGNRYEHNNYNFLHPNSSNILTACNYAQSNGASSCLNRNRYMPYSHNRSCAAAAAATAAVANTTNFSRINGFGSIQQPLQNSAIYQNGQNSTTTTTAGSSSSLMSVVRSSSYERAGMIAAQKNHNDIAYENTRQNDISFEKSFVQMPPQVRDSSSKLASTTLPLLSVSSSSSSSSSVSSSLSSVSASSSSSSSSSLISPSLSIASSSQNQSNRGPSPSNILPDSNQAVTLQINNLDYSMDEASLRIFLLNQLKSITPVMSLVFEGTSNAKVTVPDARFAKQVVAYLHRKKIGHKRMVVSYTRDSSPAEINTLRCQVAGLLKDVPHYTLAMYKFRELFQSRFKTSISVLDLYKMQDICNITVDSNEEKYINLQPELISSLENSPLIEGFQHSVPYCTIHFKREEDKGWAEQDIEPIPNVSMTVSEIQKIIYPLLKSHRGDIPIASLVHCIEGELNIKIESNDNGVNLEHLICCVQGIQIQINKYGIKILNWLEPEVGKEPIDSRNLYTKQTTADPLYQISREVIELVKMSPKSTMKFNRFIPAYHNHFGKQCRVAEYGYTKLIELFEALSSVVQIIGDGENRQITLTHRTQIRRFTSDLLRVLRAHGNKSILLSQLPAIFSQTQKRKFNVTDYGVCDIIDILDGLVNSNIVVVTRMQNEQDILISIPKRKQTNSEIEKTCIFAGEVVELFRNSPQYSILFQKFVRSYHYHFAYQCRLSDYGFVKLADLMEAIAGVVEIQSTNDEDKRIFLSPKVARRIFSEQLKELVWESTGLSNKCIKFDEVLDLHKKKFGYQIQPSALGVSDITEAVLQLPYVELIEKEGCLWITCHLDDNNFRKMCYRSCKLILTLQSQHQKGKDHLVNMNEFIKCFNASNTEMISENIIHAMKHAIEVETVDDTKFVRITNYMSFIISVVHLLEQKRGSMLLIEIKYILNVGITKCSEFGYPNLFSMLRAYPDIFEITMRGPQERSEVNLIPNNELLLQDSSSHQMFFGSIKLPSLKNYNSSIRIPLKDLTNSDNPKKPLKNPKCMPSSEKHFPIPVHQPNPFSANLSTISNVFYPSSSMSLSSSILNNSHNKENSFFNASFDSSSASLSDPNTSFGSLNAPLMPRKNPKMWECPQANNYVNNNNASKIFWNDTDLNSSTQFIEPTIFREQLSDRHSNEFDYSVNMCSTIGHPIKTESLPSENTPFWIDPIWTNNGNNEATTARSLNIRLPDIKMLNVFPILMSPYTISKTENMKKQMFDFENYDRKNA